MKYLIYIPVFLLLFYTLSIFYKNDNSFDQDLGRHLKLGEIIVSTGQVPKTNLFSYTNPNFSFINSHFLFEVFVFLWNRFLNLQSLLIFKISIILISVSLIIALIKKSHYPLLLPLGYLFLHILRERTDLRPEIFSYFFISLSFFILERYSRSPKTKLIFLLPFIQFLWIDTHIYFFLGFILQAIYFIDFFIKKEFLQFKNLILIFSVSLLVSLINPNFINSLLYPFNVLNNYGYTIAENQNIFLLEGIGFKDNNFLFYKICSLIVLISILFSLLRKTFSSKNILIVLLGLIMASVNIRSFPLLFFLCFPIVIQNFNIKKFSQIIILLNILIAVLLILESYLYFNGSYYKQADSRNQPKLVLQENAKNAMDFVLKNNLPQPIYNNFDIGSYIIYRGYPKYKVFVDGRPEAYPTSFFQQVYILSQENFENFKQLDEKINFQTVIFSITDQTPWGQNFLKNIVNDKNWSVVYLDDFMIILVKENVINAKNLTRLNLYNLTPDNYSYDNFVSYLRIGYFLQYTNFKSSSQKFINQAFVLKEKY